MKLVMKMRGTHAKIKDGISEVSHIMDLTILEVKEEIEFTYL
jgi:hypothetical protein